MLPAWQMARLMTIDTSHHQSAPKQGQHHLDRPEPLQLFPKRGTGPEDVQSAQSESSWHGNLGMWQGKLPEFQVALRGLLDHRLPTRRQLLWRSWEPTSVELCGSRLRRFHANRVTGPLAYHVGSADPQDECFQASWFCTGPGGCK